MRIPTMTHARTVPLLMTALGLLAGPPSGAQDLQDRVEKVLDRIEESRGAGLWEGIRELGEVEPGLLEGARRGLTRADPFARLAAAKVLYDGGRQDEALEAIVKVAAGKNPAAQRAAADLIVSLVAKDPDLDEADRRPLQESLRRQAAESDDPLAQVFLWRAVWGLQPSSIEPVRKVREIHDTTALRSVKEEAALVLAQMGQFIRARPTLEALAQEPGDRGRMAAAYLQLGRLSETASGRLETRSKYDFRLLEEVLDELTKSYHDVIEIDPKKLIEGAARGAAGSLDPYTAYMDEKQIEYLMKEELEGVYGGIGARVSMRKDKAGTAWLTIEEPIFSGPAYRAGLRSGDRIVEIGDESTLNRDLQDLVRRLRGKAGTKAKISVVRRGWLKHRPYEILRENIQLETTVHQMLPGQIGYIRISTFGGKDDDLVAVALRNLHDMKALILDLRGNSGGFLPTALRIASCFLDKGKLVLSTRARGHEQERLVADGSKLTGVPVVVLIDGGSASASEILAGALKDHGRAFLVGERTFGKGSVQVMKYLEATGRKSALKVTVSKWYLPSGASVEKEENHEGGVPPDLKVEPLDRDFWKDAEFERLRAIEDVGRYVQETWEADPDRVRRLAQADGGDVSRYPGLDRLHTSLQTKASENDLRELVRELMRKKVQDDQGRQFYTDVQTDLVLQRGILEACRLASVDPTTIEAFALFSASRSAIEEAPPK